jgi:integrase
VSSASGLGVAGRLQETPYRPDLSIAGAERLLGVIDAERLEAFYVLALATGLRYGELLAQRWDDVDLSSRQFEV